MKKNPVIAGIIALIISIVLSVSCASGRNQYYSNAGFSLKEDLSHGIILLEGKVHNISVNKIGSVKIRLYEKDDSLYADGEYDSKNLFGRFTSEAVTVTRETPDFVCIHFEGMLSLGDDGSGFNPGTETEYDMSLILYRGGADGIYQIGEIGNDIEWDQFGTLELRRVR